MQAALLLSTLPTETVGESLDMKKLYDAVNVTLSLQVIICYIAFCDSAALLLAEYYVFLHVGWSILQILSTLFGQTNLLLLFLEALQNDDGGFATYELTRSYKWLEVSIFYVLLF